MFYTYNNSCKEGECVPKGMGSASSLACTAEQKSSICFIDFEAFKRLKSFPRYPEQKDLVVTLDKLDAATYEKSFVVFISHTWLRTWRGSEGWDGTIRPDNADNIHFKLCCEGIEFSKGKYAPGMERCYIWIDYGCVDQTNNAANQLKTLHLIMQLCDCMFTPMYDKHPNIWKLPKVSTQMRDDYKCLGWTGTPYSYVNRAWCRLEMFYAASIPLIESEERRNKFAGSLWEHKLEQRRAHIVYGTYEKYHKLFPTFMPLLETSSWRTIRPEEGNVSIDTDRDIIKSLVQTLLPYMDMTYHKPGYKGEYGPLGLREGQGKFLYPNGDMYEGEWFYGKFDGFGKYTYTNGDYYEGQWMNHKKDGKGHFHSAEFEEDYVGEWKNDMRHGQGRFQYVNGSVYEGEYKYNQMDGYGKYIYSSGMYYEGEWRQEQRHGKGKSSYDGHVYEGDWYEDRMEGNGMYSANGDVYIGQWKNNVKHGIGKLMLATGDVFEGHFVEDMQTGFGILTMSEGVVYEGLFRNGMMEGQGKYITAGGDIYEGEFKEDTKHGEGKLIQADATVLIGRWERDRFCTKELRE
jgi:hypothetical protein